MSYRDTQHASLGDFLESMASHGPGRPVPETLADAQQPFRGADVLTRPVSEAERELMREEFCAGLPIPDISEPGDVAIWRAEKQAEASAETPESRAAWDRVGQARAELDKALEAGGERAAREAEAAFERYLDAWYEAAPEDAEASAKAEIDAIIDQAVVMEAEAEI